MIIVSEEDSASESASSADVPSPKEVAHTRPHTHLAHGCYVCHEPASATCERCERPVCKQHTIQRAGMHWELRRTGPQRAPASWKRYVLSGAMLSVCPGCIEGLLAEQRREIKRDQRQVRRRVISRVVVLLTGMALLVGYYVASMLHAAH